MSINLSNILLQKLLNFSLTTAYVPCPVQKHDFHSRILKTRKDIFLHIIQKHDDCVFFIIQVNDYLLIGAESVNAKL
jgi:hypothetical protein